MVNLREILENYSVLADENIKNNQPTALYARSKNLHNYLTNVMPPVKDTKITIPLSNLKKNLAKMTIEPNSVTEQYKESEKEIKIILKHLETIVETKE